MMPSPKYQSNGKKAEDTAVKYLQKNGHKIIARNFKIAEGEIDIISINDGAILLNEVKSRSGGGHYITKKQMERIWYAYNCFLQKNSQYTDFDARLQLIVVQNGSAQIIDII